MRKITVFFLAFAWALFFLTGAASARSNSIKTPDLASTDWSVNAPRNLALNSPSLAAVQTFEHRAFGAPEDLSVDRVCGFRFADLRHSGNLSLVISVNGGGNGGCNLTYIFNRTAAGLELYSSDGVFASNDGIQDANHDGKFEVVLWAPIAWPSEVGMQCDWPLVFAWTGSGYNDVSSKYKEYYEGYLSSLNKQLATYHSGDEEAETEAGQVHESVPTVKGPGFQAGYSRGQENSLGSVEPSSERTGVPPPTPDLSDYECTKIKAAKTEAFLGIRSDATISAAIKDAESNDPNRRTLAAVTLSFIKTPEAMSDLKTLANDSDASVAKTAKDRPSDGTEPDDYYREIEMEPMQWRSTTP